MSPKGSILIQMRQEVNLMSLKRHGSALIRSVLLKNASNKWRWGRLFPQSQQADFMRLGACQPRSTPLLFQPEGSPKRGIFGIDSERCLGP